MRTQTSPSTYGGMARTRRREHLLRVRGAKDGANWLALIGEGCVGHGSLSTSFEANEFVVRRRQLPELRVCAACVFRPCYRQHPVVMHRLMDAVAKKIQATKEEREARRQFTISSAGEVPSMRKQASPAAQQQQQQAEE